MLLLVQWQVDVLMQSKGGKLNNGKEVFFFRFLRNSCRFLKGPAEVYHPYIFLWLNFYHYIVIFNFWN